MADPTHVLKMIDKTLKLAREKTSSLPELIYDFQDKVSRVWLAKIQKGGAAGWAASVLDPDGQPVFSESEAEALEKKVGELEGFIQRGGAVAVALDPKDISIDQAYATLIGYMDKLDEMNRIFSKELGVLKLVNDMPDPKIPIPGTPVVVPIPAKTLPYMINAFLEMIRLTVSFGFLKSDILRYITSIVIALFDVLRGEWKHGLLSLLGLWSSGGVAAGIVLKILRDAWLLINPAVRIDLRDNIYESGKSLFIGFWLWAAATGMPEPFRGMANKFFDDIREKFAVFIPSLANSKLTLDDIQKVQALLSKPEVACSDEIQAVFAPMMALPPFRLAFELIGVPTTDYFREKKCAGIAGLPLEEIIAKSLGAVPAAVPAAGLAGELARATRPPPSSPQDRV